MHIICFINSVRFPTDIITLNRLNYETSRFATLLITIFTLVTVETSVYLVHFHSKKYADATEQYRIQVKV